MEWWRDQKRCVINVKNVAVVVLIASNILSEFVSTKTLTSDRSSALFLSEKRGGDRYPSFKTSPKSHAYRPNSSPSFHKYTSES